MFWSTSAMHFYINLSFIQRPSIQSKRTLLSLSGVDPPSVSFSVTGAIGHERSLLHLHMCFDTISINWNMTSTNATNSLVSTASWGSLSLPDKSLWAALQKSFSHFLISAHRLCRSNAQSHRTGISWERSPLYVCWKYNLLQPKNTRLQLGPNVMRFLLTLSNFLQHSGSELHADFMLKINLFCLKMQLAPFQIKILKYR